MATGITKLEQNSLDAISVLDLHEERIPLPSEDEVITLDYPNKAPIDEIIKDSPHRFVQIKHPKENLLGEIPDNAFILDDNLFVLNKLLSDNKKATLFYLDPPYGTGFDFQSRNLEHAYRDKMGQATYLEFMRRRLILMRECMTDDGSLYVQIGHQMLAHVKVLLDEIFGPSNFRNLITRRKCSSKNSTRRQFANINDYILFYAKGKAYKWEQPGIEPEREWIEKEYPKTDESGHRFKLVPLHAPGMRNGETGKPWRGVLPPPGKHWQHAPAKLDELDRRGAIHWSRNGNPRRKLYWMPGKQRTLADYWDSYRDAHHQSIKITGYPTEKNLEMIMMIVKASSEAGDLVIDPFCGSGTTLQAAHALDRRFIGIDSSFSAAKATLRRLRHGPEPMGDYMNKESTPVAELPIAAVDEKDAPCAFIVNSRLLEAYDAEVKEIGVVPSPTGLASES